MRLRCRLNLHRAAAWRYWTERKTIAFPMPAMDEPVPVVGVKTMRECADCGAQQYKCPRCNDWHPYPRGMESANSREEAFGENPLAKLGYPEDYTR